MVTVQGLGVINTNCGKKQRRVREESDKSQRRVREETSTPVRRSEAQRLLQHVPHATHEYIREIEELLSGPSGKVVRAPVGHVARSRVQNRLR